MTQTNNEDKIILIKSEQNEAMVSYKGYEYKITCISYFHNPAELDNNLIDFPCECSFSLDCITTNQHISSLTTFAVALAYVKRSYEYFKKAESIGDSNE